MAVRVSKAEQIAWDFLDAGDYCGGDTLRNWAVSTVEAVQEFIEDGNEEDRLFEVSEGAVPVYTGQLLALVADSVTLAASEPEAVPDRYSPAAYCEAVLHDLARDLVQRAWSELAGGDE